MAKIKLTGLPDKELCLDRREETNFEGNTPHWQGIALAQEFR